MNRARQRVLPGVEVRGEELLEHRGRQARAPAARQRRQDDRHVHVALVVRRENDRPLEAAQVLDALDARVRKQPGERHDPGRVRQPPDQPHRPAAVPRRELERLVERLGRRRFLDKDLQVREARRAREPRLVDPRLKPVLERHHQLDPFERCQPELLERRRAADVRPRANRAISASTESPSAAASGCAPAATQSRMARRFSLRVPSVRGSSVPGHTETSRIRW